MKDTPFAGSRPSDRAGLACRTGGVAQHLKCSLRVLRPNALPRRIQQVTLRPKSLHGSHAFRFNPWQTPIKTCCTHHLRRIVWPRYRLEIRSIARVWVGPKRILAALGTVVFWVGKASDEASLRMPVDSDQTRMKRVLCNHRAFSPAPAGRQRFNRPASMAGFLALALALFLRCEVPCPGQDFGAGSPNVTHQVLISTA